MKKMILLCCIPFILLTLLVSFFLIIPTQMKYPFTITKGDKSMLKGVAFNVNINSGIEDSKSGAMITEIKNKEGNVSYQIQHHVRDYRQLSKLGVSLDDQVYVYDTVNSYQVDEDPECTLSEEEVSTLPLTFKISTADEKNYQELYDKNDKLITLNTRLYLQSSDEKSLYHSKRTCKETGTDRIYYEENRDYLKLKDETVQYNSKGDFAIQEDKNTYYFMPRTDSYLEGENAIYKITLETYKKYNVKQYTASTSELFTLPQGRYYKYLTLMNDQLIVFAYDDEQSYVMRYEKDGTLIEERKLGEIFNDTWVYLNQNDHYFIFSSIDHINVMDMNTYELVERYKTQEGSVVYNTYDAIYKNNMLYIIDIPYDKDKDYHNPPRDMVYEIRGIKNETLVFQASQDCLKHSGIQEFNNYQQCDRIMFER